MLYLMLANGFEETEAIAALDVIRRGGLEIKTVGVNGLSVTGAHGVKLEADILPEEIYPDNADGIILPGGMPGTLNLKNSTAVIQLLNVCRDNGALIAAICAAPSVLGELGMLEKKKAVCFPGFEDRLKGAVLQSAGVVCDGNFITAKGAGVALEFGAAITDYFADKADMSGTEILKQMQMKI